MKVIIAPNSIAYFCSEYAVTADDSMYAGGLGVLAGDYLFEAADEKMPFVALGLKYDKTKTAENGFELLTGSDGQSVIVEVPIGESAGAKKIFLRTWVKSFGERTFLMLLDSNFVDNAEEDRLLGELYDQNFSRRLKQEVCLGLGGFRLLKALGVKPRKYHINEGSMAFTALAVLAEGCTVPHKTTDKWLAEARSKIVSTKHTILSIGTKIPDIDLWKEVGAYCEMYGISKDLLMSLGLFSSDKRLFATTKFMLNLSGRANAVSRIHAVSEKQKYPESQLDYVTNGVYVPRWQSPLWRSAGDITDLPDAKIWEIKNRLRQELVEEVHKLTDLNLDPNICTLVWSRRFAQYKRPLAIFADLARLKNIVLSDSKPLQIIISGKIAGTDYESVRLMEQVRKAAHDPAFKGRITFISNYSLDLAEKFVSGADIWLNTPIGGFEACGTSGMKAGLNGALMASVSDGWMAEVDWQGIGWILSNEDKDLAPSIYNALDNEILPEFYLRNTGDVPEAWVKRMRATMNIVEANFSAGKMIQEYEKKMYGKIGDKLDFI